MIYDAAKKLEDEMEKASAILKEKIEKAVKEFSENSFPELIWFSKKTPDKAPLFNWRAEYELDYQKDTGMEENPKEDQEKE